MICVDEDATAAIPAGEQALFSKKNAFWTSAGERISSLFRKRRTADGPFGQQPVAARPFSRIHCHTRDELQCRFLGEFAKDWLGVFLSWEV